MKPKLLVFFSVVYLAILSTEIYAEHVFVTTKDFTLLSIFQPSLVPALIVYLLLHFKWKFTPMAKWTLAGLSLDWISDMMLTGFNDEFNLPCVIGYLIANICYGMAFVTSAKQSGYKVSFINRFILSLPPIFFIVVYYFFLYNYISLHEVKSFYLVPVTIYAAGILFMATTALWRMGTTNASSYWCIASGAILYLISDSITGYDHFIEPVRMRYVANMFAYGTSLYLFTLGTLLHHPPTKKI